MPAPAALLLPSLCRHLPFCSLHLPLPAPAPAAAAQVNLQLLAYSQLGDDFQQLVKEYSAVKASTKRGRLLLPADPTVEAAGSMFMCV